jgi:hypothetical protein
MEYELEYFSPGSCTRRSFTMDGFFDFHTEGYPTKEEIQPILDPFVDRFATCWQRGWGRWDGLAEDDRSRLSPIARAVFVQNIAVSFVKETFAGVDGIVTCEELGFFKVYIQNAVILRMKRLDRDYLASNVETEQQKRYYRQLPMAGIINGLPRISLGYRLNVAKTAMDDILVSFQVGDDLLWYYSIDPLEGKGVKPMPSPIEPTGPTVTPRVRPAITPRKAANDA